MLRDLILITCFFAASLAYSLSKAAEGPDHTRPIFNNIEKTYIPLPIYDYVEQVSMNISAVSNAEFKLILNRLKSDLNELPEIKPQTAYNFAEIQLLLQIVFARANMDFFGDIKSIRNLVGRKLYYLPEYEMWSYKLDWILTKFELESLPSKKFVQDQDKKLVSVETVQLRRKLETIETYLKMASKFIQMKSKSEAATAISASIHFYNSAKTGDMDIKEIDSQFAKVGDSAILAPSWAIANAKCSALFTAE